MAKSGSLESLLNSRAHRSLEQLEHPTICELRLELKEQLNPSFVIFDFCLNLQCVTQVGFEANLGLYSIDAIWVHCVGKFKWTSARSKGVF
jgi:hypothetical protein